MSGRLTVLSHASTAATVAARFPRDEPLDDRGAAWASDARGRLTRADTVSCSPALSCRQTAAAVSLTAEVDPLLRDWDLGRWRGRTLNDVTAAEPDAMQSWLTVPSGAPHGGEPLIGVLARAAEWLATVPDHGHTVAVTHPAVVRAVILCALDAPPSGFWRIDVAPLTTTVLRGGPERWTLRSTGRPLASDTATAT